MLTSLVDTFKELDLIRNYVLLLLSDAAPYMIKSGRLLVQFFPRMQHVFCTAHIVHNAIGKLVKDYRNVKNFISTLKATVVKTTSRKNLFFEIGQPLEHILTRWGSWLKAVKYYIRNIVEVTRIVNSFEGEGKIIKNTKQAVNSPGVFQDLVYIENNYIFLLDILKDLEDKKHSINTIVEKLKNSRLDQDFL